MEPRPGPAEDRAPLECGATVFLAGFLLFEVQLILGKRLLPWFGGAPAVWLTCLLFFQTALLAGYAYAHALVRWLPPRRQALVHGALLVAASATLALHAASWGSPLLPPAGWRAPAGSNPIGQILRLLAASAGLPALALAATSPLVQAWVAGARTSAAAYRLYAPSNLGSLLGLLTYVLAVEPLLPLARQAALWSGLFALLAAVSWLVARRTGEPERSTGAHLATAEPSGDPPGLRGRTLWLGLALAGSALLLAVSRQICQELPVLPILWVLPLAIYLATYVLAFRGPRWRDRRLTGPLLVAAVTAACLVLYYQLDLPVAAQVGVFSLLLFAGALACHGELARRQPPARWLTGYYLAIALGGALGGALVAVVAPLALHGPWELHAAILAACGFVLWARMTEPSTMPRPISTLGTLATAALGASWLVGSALQKGSVVPNRHGIADLRALVVGATLAGAGFLAWRLRASPLPRRFVARVELGGAFALLAATLGVHGAALTAGSRFALRDFFAVLRVEEVAPADEARHAFWLLHGRIVHGFQYAPGERRDRPTAYYGPQSGVAAAVRHHPRRSEVPDSGLRIGVLGLGVGTVAALAERGDSVRFYEISPAVARLARGEGGFFSFLADSPATTEVVLGDARVRLEDERRLGRERPFDLLVLDAFSSGAVPAHLLTREAFALYLASLQSPGGILAINASNRDLDLPRVVWRQARELGLHGVTIDTPAAPDGETWHSLWILLSRDPAAFDDPGIAELATAAPDDTSDFPLWTDDHSSLLPLLRTGSE
ncbi:MAG: hypothetical protein U0X73_01125 [Thermoanaerobaculia bacterium]